MAKDMRLALLLDFYGGLLTEKQLTALDGYYNQDLSLSELAAEMAISRQGVMAFLKQGEKHLRDFEAKLGLAAKFEEINAGLKEMKSIVEGAEPRGEKEMLLGLIDRLAEMI